MSPIPHAISLVLFLGAAIAWIIGLRYFLRLSNELQRARRSAEASFIPPGNGKGLPVMVIFGDALPRVNHDRIKMLWAVGVFYGICLAVLAIIVVYGPHHP